MNTEPTCLTRLCRECIPTYWTKYQHVFLYPYLKRILLHITVHIISENAIIHWVLNLGCLVGGSDFLTRNFAEIFNLASSVGYRIVMPKGNRSFNMQGLLRNFALTQLQTLNKYSHNSFTTTSTICFQSE